MSSKAIATVRVEGTPPARRRREWRNGRTLPDSSATQSGKQRGDPSDACNRPSNTAGNFAPRDEAGFNDHRLKGLATLIVEDEIIDQKLAAINIARSGFNPTVVSSAADAIESLQRADNERPFQLLLMDFKIPKMNGLAASNLIKNRLGLKAPPKIILLSSYDRDDIFANAAERQFIDEFMTKPVTKEKLWDAIAHIQQTAERQGSPWPIDHNDQDTDANDELLAKTHVLLAEDNTINQRVAAGILKQKGVQVTVANNGEEAVTKTLASKPGTIDLILMDIDMPKVDGYQASQTILNHADYRHIPIIALTAHIGGEERQHCAESGMVDFLTKPVKPEDLYRSILKHLR